MRRLTQRDGERERLALERDGRALKVEEEGKEEMTCNPHQRNQIEKKIML